MYLKNKLLRWLIAPFFMYEGDPAAGGGGAATPPKPATPPAGPETFSREYVAELRAENASWRTKNKEAEDARKAAEDAKKAAEDAAAAKIAEANAAADKRILMAELKASALKAGMVDLDGLKLADLSSVKLNDQGQVEGADALMEELKKSKPWLFGAPGTSHTGNPPNPKTPEAKKATEMNDAEYKAAKAAMEKGKKK